MANYTLRQADEDHWARKLYKLRKKAIEVYSEMALDAYTHALETEELFIVDKINDLPQDSGIYFIYDKDQLVYIGKARNIKSRLRSHPKYKPGYSIGCWLFPIEDIRYMEWTMIAVLKPPDQKIYYLDTNFLNNFDISKITGINYRKPKLKFWP